MPWMLSHYYCIFTCTGAFFWFHFSLFIYFKLWNWSDCGPMCWLLIYALHTNWRQVQINWRLQFQKKSWLKYVNVFYSCYIIKRAFISCTVVTNILIHFQISLQLVIIKLHGTDMTNNNIDLKISAILLRNSYFR